MVNKIAKVINEYKTQLLRVVEVIATLSEGTGGTIFVVGFLGDCFSSSSPKPKVLLIVLHPENKTKKHKR